MQVISWMESVGIGTKATRPYISRTIEDRGYSSKYFPTSLGTKIANIFKSHAPSIVNPEFTRRTEEIKEKLRNKELKWQNGMSELNQIMIEFFNQLNENRETIQQELINIGGKCPDHGNELLIREGPYGKYFACPIKKCKQTRMI
jgi:DNA topoisomerase-1